MLDDSDSVSYVFQDITCMLYELMVFSSDCDEIFFL